MSALIVTVAPGGRAWVSTDTRYRHANGRIEDAPLLRGGIACCGAAVVGSQGMFDVMDGFCAWAEPMTFEGAVEGGAAWLRANARDVPQTIALVCASRGCLWIFDDGYHPHPLEPGAGHCLRPGDIVDFEGLDDLWERAAGGIDVEALHREYLARAAAAVRGGLIDLHGMPAAIGGGGMCARLTASGVDVVGLGALQ